MKESSVRKKSGRPRLSNEKSHAINSTVPESLVIRAKIAAAHGGTTVAAMLRDGLELVVLQIERQRNGGKPFLSIQPPQE